MCHQLFCVNDTIDAECMCMVGGKQNVNKNCVFECCTVFELNENRLLSEMYKPNNFYRTSSRPDLVSIQPVYTDRYSDCSQQVVITAASSRDKKRNTAVVLAEDSSTGEILRADVIMDVIHELGVLTTTRELFIEEVPEAFKMWAFDSQGNGVHCFHGLVLD